MLREFFRGLRDLIYPNSCLICKKVIPQESGRETVCSGCWNGIEKNLPPFCSRCGRHLAPQAIAKNSCPHCSLLAQNFYFDRGFSPCVYSGTIKKLIHEFKYRGKDYLAGALGGLLREFIREYQIPIECLDFIVPVPLHASRKREREFNQSEILGAQISREFGLPVLDNCLARIKPTKSQTGLSFAERWANMESSFIAKEPQILKNSAVLLIDDVLTTGATASLAAKCLKNSGADKVILLTLAS